MNYIDIQKQIDNTDYWDERVISLDCNYFSDEVIITFKNCKGKIQLSFEQCYNVVFNHVKHYNKNIAVKKMMFSQMPYFLQSIDVSETFDSGERFFKCEINMFPLNIQVLCKNIATNISNEY